MPRPLLTRRSLRRMLASLAVGASLAVLSPSAAFAQRPSSPYAFDDDSLDLQVDSPLTDAAALRQDPDGTTPGGATQGPTNLSNPTTGPLDQILPAAEDVAPDLALDPRNLPSIGNALPKTGSEIMDRVWFAALLVATGLLVLEAGRKRAVWSR